MRVRRAISNVLRPDPHPPSAPSPRGRREGGRGVVTRSHRRLPSPAGRRWREAPDEGSPWRQITRCARTLIRLRHLLPGGEGNARARSRDEIAPKAPLLPPGEGGAKRRMRVRRAVSTCFARTLIRLRHLLPGGEGNVRARSRDEIAPKAPLLPPGEGGAKRRMRVRRAVSNVLRPNPHPPSAPSPRGRRKCQGAES